MDTASKSPFWLSDRRLAVLSIVIASTLLMALSRADFIAFHTTVELSTVAISILIALSCRAAQQAHYGYIAVLGVVYGCTGLFDLLHTISYKGFPLAISHDANLATQYWIGGRLIESLGLACAFSCHWRKSACRYSALLFIALSAIVLINIYPLSGFPQAYSEQTGLTAFKVNAELGVIALTAFAAFALQREHQRYSPRQLRYFHAAMALTIAAEICFTQYGSVYDATNALGHLLRLASYICLYLGLLKDQALVHSQALKRINLRPLLYALLLTGTGLMASFVVQSHQQAMSREHQFHLTSARLKEAAASISVAMQARLRLTDSLKAFVSANPDFSPQQFTAFTTALEQNLTGIKSLQLAPDGIVRYVSRPEHNRAAIGHNLLAGAQARAAAEKAIRERRFIIAGPMPLLQGGRAIIARQPIFNIQGSGDDVFWGFATVLIDIDALINEVLLEELRKDYRIAMRGKDGLGAEGEVFIGDAAVFDQAGAIKTIELGGGSWQIAAIPLQHRAGGNYLLSPWFWPLMVGLAYLSSFLLYQVFNYPYRLQAAVNRATLQLNNEIEKRRRSEQKANDLANHDALTGLHNRRLFNELASAAIAQASRRRESLALYFMDLDGFKQVNDTLGHARGDQLLMQVSRRISAIVRQSDLVARIGGDEFVALLTDTPSSDPRAAIEIIEAISKPFVIEGNQISISISIGIAYFPTHGHSLESLLSAADNAMYRAKEAGKNGYYAAPVTITSAR